MTQQEFGGIPTSLGPVRSRINALLNSPFFELVRSGELDFMQVRVFAKQYYAASIGFTEILAAIIAAGVSEELKFQIVINLWDEFGKGHKELFHREMLKKLLVAVDCDPKKIEPCAATKAYLQGMRSLCLNASEPEILGAIGPGCELFTPAEYRIIRSGLLKSGHVNSEDLIFFDDHISHDAAHTRPLIALVEQEASKGNLSLVIGGALQAIEFEEMYWTGVHREMIQVG